MARPASSGVGKRCKKPILKPRMLSFIAPVISLRYAKLYQKIKFVIIFIHENNWSTLHNEYLHTIKGHRQGVVVRSKELVSMPPIS